MTLASGTSYPHPECLSVLFNLQYPGSEVRLSRERAGWCSFADIKEFYPGRAALIVRPGGVLEVTK